MRTYSNIFIHIPGFTKSDLEFISNSTTHEEVTLLAATCGMFIEKIHFYDPSTIPLHNQYEMKLVDTDVFEIAMFLDEIKAYETVYIGSRRISGNGAHLIHVGIRYNNAAAPEEVYKIIQKYEYISEKTCIVCGRPATKISTGYISPYCDDCYQQYYKDKPYSVIKNWYGWTGSNIENKQVVS